MPWIVSRRKERMPKGKQDEQVIYNTWIDTSLKSANQDEKM